MFVNQDPYPVNYCRTNWVSHNVFNTSMSSSTIPLCLNFSVGRHSGFCRFELPSPAECTWGKLCAHGPAVVYPVRLTYLIYPLCLDPAGFNIREALVGLLACPGVHSATPRY
jgi:hypothetical protein